MNKIKIFLGGYINYKNAQNINCKSIASHLDREKYDVYTLMVHYGENMSTSFNVFYCFRPFSFSRHIGFLWGILKCDIAYLPKHIDTPSWILYLANLINKPLFTTIEGKIKSKETSYSLVNLFGNDKIMYNHFKHIKYIYGISQHIIDGSKDILTLQPEPLFLGVDISEVNNNICSQLTDVVFIGSLIERKRVHEFILLAKQYNSIKFNIIGDGPERNNLERDAPHNVIFHGLMNYDSIYFCLNMKNLLDFYF